MQKSEMDGEGFQPPLTRQAVCEFPDLTRRMCIDYVPSDVSSSHTQIIYLRHCLCPIRSP